MKQPSLFGTPEYEITKPIRLIELFGGVGSQSMGLRDIGADFEHYRLVEFDPYPVKSYNAIHGTNFVPTDIRNIHGSDLGIVDTNIYIYICCYSFPCQDLSVAGLGKGMKKGSGTRSGLLWEVERLLNETENLPQVLLMENVPQVIADKNIEDFKSWISFLSSKGYSNFYKILNAKDYGIPQSRERCFMVSLLGDYDFEFPEPIPLQKKMVDFLEDEVDEKYYLKSEKAKKLIEQLVQKGVLESESDRQTDNYGLLTEVSTIQKSSQLQTVSRQDKTVESVTSGLKETVSLNYNKIQDVGKEIASTILAHDHSLSGGTMMSNGVIEKWN
ncbi:MAG: DNA cytosine methyltransferase [Treponema sp.]|nr:DNA cytosine methyltransferase [Treponema sp.]